MKPSFTIGIEEEYQTIDPVTYDLRSHINAEIIAKDEPDDEGQSYEVRVDPRHKAAFSQRFSGRIETP